MNRRVISISIIIAVLIAIITLGFLDFEKKIEEEANNTLSENTVLDVNEQGYVILDEAKDDFAAIEDALNSLDN